VRIGTVEAPTAEDAIKVAIRDYGITDPERQQHPPHDPRIPRP
jgi:hypothetical protein